jgi:hypothetical protein
MDARVKPAHDPEKQPSCQPAREAGAMRRNLFFKPSSTKV